MLKTNLKKQISALGIKQVIFAMVALLMLPAFKAQAAESDLPEISYYYPWKMEDSPVELNPTMQANVFFKTGAQVLSVKALIVQNGDVTGTCEYVGKDGASNIVVLDQQKAVNADMLKIAPGEFTLKLYEIKYLSGGVEKTYSDMNNPIDEVTYVRSKPEGVLVSTSGMGDQTIRSYYDPKGTEGVRTYTFDCQIDYKRLKVYFDYGMGNTYILTPLEWTLSDDMKVLTIDLRGKCYNVDALAPGVVFLDDNGNPCPPPTVISISIENLISVDGNRISTTSKSLDGMHSTKLSGRLYENFYYEDLTFETPTLLRAEYFNKDNQKVRYNNINDQTDMMELYISDLANLKKANVKLVKGDIREVVKYEDITVSSGSYTFAIPQSIREAGSDNMSISLINVEFISNDGAAHEIEPLGGTVEDDILTIAEVKDLPNGSEVLLNTIDGVKVTMSNEAGYMFFEDATGGLQIVTPDYSKVLNQGTLLQGRIAGTYLGDNVLMIDIDNCDFTETDADVSKGTEISTIDQITNGSYYNCLVTIKASERFDIVYDDEDGYIIINNYLPVVTDLVEDFVLPEKIYNITGILYNEPNLNQKMLIVRSMDDINIDLGGTDSIESLTIESVNANEVYNLQGMKVRSNGESLKGLNHGIYIINGKKAIIK